MLDKTANYKITWLDGATSVMSGSALYDLLHKPEHRHARPARYEKVKEV